MSRLKRAVVAAALLAGLATAGVALAQTSTNFDLSWNVLGGGGGTSESASFAAEGTTGQPIVGRSESGSFALDAGFWPGAAGPAEPTSTGLPPATATPTGGPPTATPPPGGVLGDVDCDGFVTAIDAALILQLNAGLVGSLPCEDLGDVNSNGTVDSIDASLILQFVAGIIGSL